jgi:adenylyltransferase/sulfurtransferase
MILTDEQFQRYKKHIILPEIGESGQIKLRNSKVFIVGAGGLGIPVCCYLTAMGVGRLAIIDDDVIELGNLQRQILYNVNSIGRPKVEVLKENLTSLNPDVEIIAINERLTEKNIYNLISEYDIIVDCSDNFSTKYLTNDACVRLNKLAVIGGVNRFEGQVYVVVPGIGYCLRCIFDEVPDEKHNDDGIVGAIPGIIGALQALEVIKIILDIGATSKDEILIFDGLKTSLRKVHVPKNPECPLCNTTTLANKD